jgi:hypothetical protein
VDGTITTPSGSTTYSVAADGTFTLGNLTGTVLEGGSAIIFGATSLTPQINIAVRKLGTFDNASLNGTYTFVSYYFKDVPQSSTPATGTPLPMPLGGSDEVGTLTFDGAGNVSYSTTYNVDGTITSSSGSTTYSVASDGTFTLGNLTGIVLEGGSVVAFGATSLTPQINLAIRR